jgi:hypothetical protein
MIVVGAAAVGAAAALGFSVLRAPTLRPERSAISAAASQRDEEMAALKRRLAQLEERAFAAAANTPPVAVPATSAGEHQDSRGPEVVERERKIARWMDDHYTTEVQGRVFGRYFADVDRLRLSEPRDKAWSESVGRDLQKLLDEAPGFSGTRVEKLECGGTLCRLHLEVEDAKKRGKLLHAIQSKLHFDEASAFIPANERKVEAYLARQGATLPFFDHNKYVEEEMD